MRFVKDWLVVASETVTLSDELAVDFPAWFSLGRNNIVLGRNNIVDVQITLARGLQQRGVGFGCH